MLDELAALAPGGGLAGFVALLLGWYAKTSREDRKEFRDALAAAKADFELRLKDEHARLLEIDMNAQTEVDELKRVNRALDAALSAERARARHAELDLEGAKIRTEHLQLRLRLARGEEVEWND